MALDERYVVASDLEQYFVDKDSGLPLANGTLTFFRDVARNVPKEVFQLSGFPPDYTYTSMGAQITLSAVGTVQNSGGDNEVIYYYPYDDEGNLDLYYVVCRDENGIEQFTREAWPNVTNANDPTKDQTSLQNQISNPTFTNVFINDGITTTYTVSAANNQVFEFAPGWDFVISGTGTVIVQRIAITGNDNVPTTPPYVIDVTVSLGVSACYLRQRFPYNSGLWASTPDHPIFLAGSFLARNESVGTTGVQMFYVESSGGSPIVIVDGSFSSSYTIVTGSTANAIPQSTNTDSGKDGYVDIYLSFITGSHVRLSAIQVVPTATSSINIVPYDVNSSNREEALQGDYYIPRLNAKRIDSYLVGWDFQMNPFQLGSSGNVGVSTDYIADQTIAIRGASGNVAFARNSITNGIQFTTAGTNDSFYIMQYLQGDQVKEMLGSRMSSNVFAYQTDVAGDAVTMRIYLFRATAAAVFPALPAGTIGTLATNGEFTLTQAGWTAIPRSGLSIPQVTLNKVTTNTGLNDGNSDYGFSGWEITDSAQIGDTDKFAIIVTFAYTDASTVVVVNSISVVPGDIPCRPALKTFDDTLRQCQYYYEKSYDNGIVPGTVGNNNSEISVWQSITFTGGNWILRAAPFVIQFHSVKRVSPNMSYYSGTAGTSNAADVHLYIAGITNNAGTVAFASNWTQQAAGTKILHFVPANAATLLTGVSGGATDAATGTMELQYVADARLGIV